MESTFEMQGSQMEALNPLPTATGDMAPMPSAFDVRSQNDKPSGPVVDNRHDEGNAQEKMDELTLSTTPSSDMSTPPTSSSSQGSPSMSLMDVEQLRIQLKRQVEYYFSRENLNHDTYLVSQMDADQYVDISIIANFNQVKKLTSDTNLIIEVLKESPCVQVDETGQRVRPLHKRTVVILREIPEGTTQQEIEEIFTHNDCPSFVSCEYASGNCWYLNFETEAHAQDAFRYIRETLQTFKGQRIMARIKAKPTPVSVTSSRPEQRADGSTAVNDPQRSQMQQSAIRYPVPLPHFPLQNPQFPFAPGAGHFAYLPYIMSHPLISPPWNPAVFHDPSFAYDVNGYSYQAMPNPPRSNSHSGAAGGRPQQGEHRRNHSRGSSNTGSERGEVPTTSQNGTSTAAAAPPKNTHSSYYNSHSRNGGQDSTFNKQSGEKLPNRSRSYGGSISSDHYNNPEIPPRHRDAQHGYRAYKRNAHSSQNHHLAPHHQSAQNGFSGPRAPRSTNHHNNRVSTNTAHNGSLPHHNRVPANPSSYDNRADNRGNKDYNNRQTNNSDHESKAQNRQHGAQRKSKSPERDSEISQQASVVKSESFELDSSAFPALPGANHTPAAVALSVSSQTTTTQPDSSSDSADKQQVANPSTDSSPSPTVKSNEPEKVIVSITAPSVPKLSDIVKNNMPDPSVAKQTVVHKPKQHAAPGPKDLTPAEKPVSATANKPHSAGKQTSAHQATQQASDKARPTQLTNGSVNNTDVKNKAMTHPKQLNASGTNSKPTPESKAELMKKVEQPSKSTDAKPSTQPATQLSPSDNKLSYAAMAQRTSTAPVTPKTSPTSPDAMNISSSSDAPTGDNNNNADNKSGAAVSAQPPTPVKSDNLYSSTAAKNTMPNAAAVVANGQRKPNPTQQQSRSNGPLKPKSAAGSARPATGSGAPASRTSSSHTPSPAVTAR